MIADWIWWVSGGVLLALGAILGGWALLFDWARRLVRGRTRRCPRCWYDLEGAASPICPECGHAPRRDRALLKARRRWRAAGLAVVILLGGSSAAMWPSLAGEGWKRWLPDPVLIALVGRVEEAWVLDELDRRLRVSWAGFTWTDERRLAHRERRWLDARLAALLSGNAPGPLKVQALDGLHRRMCEPRAVVPAIIACIDSPDSNVRQYAIAALRAVRFELGPLAPDCLRAIERCKARDPRLHDVCAAAEDALTLMIEGGIQAIDPPAGPSPEELARWLESEGAAGDAGLARSTNARRLLDVWSVEPRPLLLAGVTRLDLDGRGENDAVVVIDAGVSSSLVLIMLHDGGTWRIAHALDGSMPAHTLVVRDAPVVARQRFLVLQRSDFARGVERREVWVRVTPRRIDPGIHVPVEESFAAASDLWIESVARRRIGAEGVMYDVEIRYLPVGADSELFRAAGTLVWRWSAWRGAFVTDGEVSTFTPAGLLALKRPTSGEFIGRFESDIRNLARDGDAVQRAWAEQYLMEASVRSEPWMRGR